MTDRGFGLNLLKFSGEMKAAQYCRSLQWYYGA